ncbi:hypothetical protein GCM10009837_07690 [Streptomyces durmitorensis]|uniref:Uncharacterized protein n=1 Tax=Streptomyces durmitorensis TaxID=319947 RepID=A0ABY4PMK6_9ACTN|nr:hypothetical protein [Streptomyces durmitorensis]UQT54342.1 hypothetical protein M4V62_04165 [Streptomyces durmitorensis]
MARIQILELPEGGGDDRVPFVLVVDQWTNPFRGYPNEWAATVGAQGVLVFEDTIDIPANDVPLDENGQPLFLKVHVEGEFERFREQVQQEVLAAQGKITRAINETDPVHERATIELDADRLGKWTDELADALGIDRLRDWDDMRDAAARLRRERDAQARAIERVRNLHRAVEYRGTVICGECSAFAGSSTDNAPVAYDQCGTLLALNGDPANTQEQA